MVGCINSPMIEISKFLESDAEFTPAVVGFLVKDNQVCLGLRKKVSFGLGENLISGIGGKIGDSPEIKDETPPQALVREFLEEVEVTPESFEDLGQVQFIFPHKPKWNQIVRVYRISSWLGELKETEVIKPMWFEENQLPKDRMWDDNSYWLPRILKGERVNMIFLFNKNNKVKEYQNVEN